MIIIKNAQEIELLRRSAEVVRDTLLEIEKHITAGVSTLELDTIAERFIRARGAVPSFLNYNGFPKSVCISINEEVVHGIPSKKRILKDGDIVGVDVGAFLNGFHGDAARTFAVGNVSSQKQQLLEVTRQCFFEAVKAITPRARVGDIGYAVQAFAERHGFGVVRQLCGHGIGKNLHEDPNVPNVGVKGRGVRLENGMAIAIEPMINMGSHEVKTLSDGWTVVTKDGLPSAHYENTVVIANGRVEILTL